MDMTLELDRSAEETIRLFAHATNLGLYAGGGTPGVTAIVEASSLDARLRLTDADPESLLSLSRMLTSGGLTLPASLRSLKRAEPWTSFDAILFPHLRGQVSLEAVHDLSGKAFFLSVQGLTSPEIYDVVRPVVAVWQHVLKVRGFPYRFDEELLEGIDSEGVEVYELSDVEVEVATTGYGGGEDGVAALVNGIARQLQRTGLAFQMRGWTG